MLLQVIETNKEGQKFTYLINSGSNKEMVSEKLRYKMDLITQAVHGRKSNFVEKIFIWESCEQYRKDEYDFDQVSATIKPLTVNRYKEVKGAFLRVATSGFKFNGKAKDDIYYFTTINTAKG